MIMPIIVFHLPKTVAIETQCATLIKQAASVFAGLLNAPLERIRIFIQLYPLNQLGSAGIPANENALLTPYFECLVLADRTTEQRQMIMREIVQVLADITQIDKGFIRGCCRRIPAEDWFIGDQAASVLRQAEITERQMP